MEDDPTIDRSSKPRSGNEATKYGTRLDNLVKRLRNGEPLVFKPADASEEHSLPADWLAEFLSSAQPSGTPVVVVIDGATIKGKLKLRYADLKVELRLLNSTFDEGIDCSFATFERQADFSGSHFHAPVEFRKATFKRDLTLTRATFAEEATLIFEDAQVEGILRAESARFAAASFKRCRLANAAFFGPSGLADAQPATSFSGDADFTDAHIEGPLYFDCVQFAGRALFRRARINSAAYFRPHSDATEAQNEETQNEKSQCTPTAPPPCLPAFTLSPLAAPPARPPAAKPLAAYFGGLADFNYVKIDGVVSFDGAQFCQQLNFVRAHLENSVFFNTYVQRTTKEVFRTTFHDEVDFTAAQVAGGLSFMGTHFHKDTRFERIKVGGHLLFKAIITDKEIINTVFDCEATFLGGYVAHNAEFDGAYFEQKATFDRLEVGRNIYFRPAFDDKKHKPEFKKSIFSGVADFVGARINGDAEFTSAHFKKQARFEGFHVEGNTFFNTRFEFPEKNLYVRPVIFFDKADFTSAHFKHRAEFYKVRFEQKAIFRSADFDGGAIFKHARFYNIANFTGSYFRQGVQFHYARFFGETDFTSADVDGAAFFKGVIFKGKTHFRAAHFKSLDFDIRDAKKGLFPGENFGNDLDLKGFTYELIDINADILDSMLKSMKTYNRQPYTQLERVLRLTGQDELADETYLVQRGREREQKKKEAKKRWRRWRGAKGTDEVSLLPWIRNKTSLLFDTAQREIGNYGVQPFLRLFLISCGVVLFGTLIFWGNGSVVPREGDDKKSIALEEESDGQRSVRTVEPDDKLPVPLPSPTPVQLAPTQAFAVSLNQFIPIVQIPSGSKWKPSEKLLHIPCSVNRTIPFISYAFYGTIHSILGVILVPLGVAALTGVLHRQEKPGK